MTRLPDTYMFIYSYTYVPFRWKGNKLSFRQGLTDTQVPRSGLAVLEQPSTAKFGDGLRNLQRHKGSPIKRSAITLVLFTDLRGKIEGSKLGISLREDSDHERRPRSESVQAPHCMALFVIPGGSQEDASVLAGSRCMPGRDSLGRQPAARGCVAETVKRYATFVSNTQVIT